MKKVHILVEGPTEEAFVKGMLKPHLAPHNIWVNPVIVTTKRLKSGPNFKGGITSYERVRDDVRRLLGDTSASLVTTLIDYYGLPPEFPGQAHATGTPHQKVALVETAFGANINHGKFRPYLSLHEFEALLFSSPPDIARTLNEPTKTTDLQRIRSAFSTPEDINDNPATAPSRRIIGHFPRYNKVLFGSLIARRIGLEHIRRECPHFNDWVSRLEQI
ncbi:MAG: DUF4276 family protein [bacterium]|nr:DUF4276 family protein [bacterium]